MGQQQNPTAIHLTEKNGLPDKEFYDIIEDEKGFIWMASNKGLYRYDGNEYKLFTHPKQIGLSVFQLNLDEDGYVWFNNLSNQLFRVKKLALAKGYFENYIINDIKICIICIEISKLYFYSRGLRKDN